MDVSDSSGCADRPSRAGVVRSEPDELDELGASIISFSGRLTAATYRFLVLIGDFDARDGSARWVMGSTSRWLQWACGMSRRTARDHVRVARAIRAHPVVGAAMAAGRLSYSQARAISRLAVEDTDLVSGLVELAEHSTVAQLEATVRGLHGVRAGEDPDPEEPTEVVSTEWTDDGGWRCAARLDAERGGLVAAALAAVAATGGEGGRALSGPDALVMLAEIALAALADTGSRRELRGDERAALVVHVDADRLRTAQYDDPISGDSTDGAPEPHEEQAASGAGAWEPASADHLAESAVEGGAHEPRVRECGAKEPHHAVAGGAIPAPESGAGEPEASGVAAGTSAACSGCAREPEVAAAPGHGVPAVVGGAHEPRVREGGAPGPFPLPVRRACAAALRPAARIGVDGPGLSDAVLRRLACAGRVRTVVHDGHGPLDVGRSRRVVTDRQYRALVIRDGGCRHPGCGSRYGLEAHHVVHWLDGGRSDMANLVLLCKVHHLKHHDGEFAITADGRGGIAFRCHDRILPTQGDTTTSDDPAAEDERGDIADDAALTKWDGSRLTIDAINVYAQYLRVAKTAS